MDGPHTISVCHTRFESNALKFRFLLDPNVLRRRAVHPSLANSCEQLKHFPSKQSQPHPTAAHGMSWAPILQENIKLTALTSHSTNRCETYPLSSFIGRRECSQPPRIPEMSPKPSQGRAEQIELRHQDSFYANKTCPCRA